MAVKVIKKSIFWLMFCIMTEGCTKSPLLTDISYIPLAKMVGKYEILNISDIANSITYIPLETNDHVLIKEIEHIIYEREKIIIYNRVLTNAVCMIFNNEGRYLRNIGNVGQGPEEYLYLANIYSYNDSIFFTIDRQI